MTSLLLCSPWSGAGRADRPAVPNSSGGGAACPDSSADRAQRPFCGQRRTHLRSPGRSAFDGAGLFGRADRKQGGVLSGGQRPGCSSPKCCWAGQSAAAGRAHQPFGHRLCGMAGGFPQNLRRLLHCHLPRPVLSRQNHLPHFEMEGKGLAAYKGNYSNYLKLKAEQRLAMEQVYSTRRKFPALRESSNSRNGGTRNGTMSPSPASKRLSTGWRPPLEKPEAEPESIKFQFHASRRSGNDVLTAEDLSLLSTAEEPLFRNVNLEIKRGGENLSHRPQRLRKDLSVQNFTGPVSARRRLCTAWGGH